MGISGVLPPQITDIETSFIAISKAGIPILAFTDKAVENKITVTKLSFDP